LSLIASSADDNLLTYSSAGVAGADSNIFAIDGNTAGSAGVAEMLLQSHGGGLEFLPALPTVLASGSVFGICGRGGYVIDMEWRDGKLTWAAITARQTGSTAVRYRSYVTQISLRAGQRMYFGPESFGAPAPATTGSHSHV
jgi:alpha-L-fucosidase 2